MTSKVAGLAPYCGSYDWQGERVMRRGTWFCLECRIPLKNSLEIGYHTGSGAHHGQKNTIAFQCAEHGAEVP